MTTSKKKPFKDRTFTFKEIIIAIVVPLVVVLIATFGPGLLKSTEATTINNITTQNNYYSRLTSSPSSPEFQREVTQNDLDIINGQTSESDTVTIFSLYESDCKECLTYATELTQKLRETGYQNVRLVNYKYESQNPPKYNGSFWIGKGLNRAFIYITKIKS